MKISYSYTIICCLFFFCSLYGQKEKNYVYKHVISSEVLGEDRMVTVFLPKNYYHPLAVKSNFGVLYVLDGGKKKVVTNGVYDFLANGVKPAIPELIIVAIHQKNRMFDLTPTKATTFPNGKKTKRYEKSGNAFAFYEFIANEVGEKVNRMYRTSGFNILTGHSFGGLNTLYTLLEKEGFFQAFIASDPSLWWDNRRLFYDAKEMLISKKFTNKSLFLAIANQQGTPSMPTSNLHQETIKSFAKLLDNSKENGLHFKHKFYEDREHHSVSMIALQDGLSFIFEDVSFQSTDYKLTREKLQERYKVLSDKVGMSFNPSILQIVNLGDLFSFKGNKKKALQFYKWALEESPNNILIKERITKITS